MTNELQRVVSAALADRELQSVTWGKGHVEGHASVRLTLYLDNRSKKTVGTHVSLLTTLNAKIE